MEIELIKNIFKHYSIDYDKDCKVLSVNQPIKVEDFIYLKRLVKLSTLDISNITVTSNLGGYYDKVRNY